MIILPLYDITNVTVKTLIIIISISAAFISANALAISTPNVPISNRVYRDIDHLIAAKLVKPVIVGQRPYARSEIARIIKEAISNRGGIKSPYINNLLDRLYSDYKDEIEDQTFVIHPMETAKFSYTYLKGKQEYFPPSNGAGSINAKINGFTAYKEGVSYNRNQIFIETVHRTQLSRYFSIYARPLFELSGNNSGAYIQNLYGKFGISNFEIQVGRDSLVWGQGQYGPMLISTNARPLDMIKLTNPSPLELPSFLKYIGPFRGTIFVSNLGPDQPHKYPYFCGYKFTLMPMHIVELGFSHTVMMGGRGLKVGDTWDAFGEFWGVRGGGQTLGETNHLMTAEIGVTLSFLRSSRAYFSITNDDKRDSIARLLKDGSSYLGGIYIPGLTSAGNSDLRVEYQNTSPIAYRHSYYPNGYTLNRNIIGSSLGPDSQGIHVEYHNDLFERRDLDFTVTFDWEQRGSNIWTTTVDPDGTMGDIFIALHKPDENRYRIAALYRRPITNEWNMEAYAGYERLHNKNFVAGSSGNNAMLYLSLKYNFDKFFKYPKN